VRFKLLLQREAEVRDCRVALVTRAAFLAEAGDGSFVIEDGVSTF